MKYALRSGIAALMLGAVGFLTALIVVAVMTFVFVAVRAGGAWAISAAIVVGLLAAVVLALLARRRRRRHSADVGVSITTDEQPLLWVEVYRVAEGLDARPPDELLLFPDTHAEISDHHTWLGLRPGVRRLRLGLPLLAGLTERQLRAVIAHELSRFGGPSRLTRVLYRAQRRIGALADRHGSDSMIGRVMERYARAYLAVAHPVTRRHELEADRLSADLAGNGATSAALLEIAVLSKGWDAFVDGYADPAAAVGRRPEDLFAGFTCFLEEPDRRTQLAGAADGPDSSRRSAYDSQPSLADRLAAIAALPEDDLHDKSGPALGMLRNPDHVIRRVEESMFHESGFVPATWEDIVPEAGCAIAREDAQRLQRLAKEGGLGPTLSVATLLELLRHGLADEMVRPLLAEGASPEAERQTATRLVTGFFATAAIETGTASYRFSWAAPRQLVDGQGVVDDLPELVDAALADGAAVPALELWLTAHHVDQLSDLTPDAPDAPDEAEAGQGPEKPGEEDSVDPTQVRRVRTGAGAARRMVGDP